MAMTLVAEFLVAANRPVKAALAQLRLAFRRSILKSKILLQNLDGPGDDPVRRLQVPWLDEVEIVGRRVVLGESAKLTALKETHG